MPYNTPDEMIEDLTKYLELDALEKIVGVRCVERIRPSLLKVWSDAQSAKVEEIKNMIGGLEKQKPEHGCACGIEDCFGQCIDYFNGALLNISAQIK